MSSSKAATSPTSAPSSGNGSPKYSQAHVNKSTTHTRVITTYFYEKVKSLVEATGVMRHGYNHPEPPTKQVCIFDTNTLKAHTSVPPNHPASQKKQPRSQLRSSMRYSTRCPWATSQMTCCPIGCGLQLSIQQARFRMKMGASYYMSSMNS